MFLGVVLGSIVPDMDALAVAFATLTGGDTHGLHRTWSHSIPFILVLVIGFYLAGKIKKSPRIINLGLGIGIGMLLHSILDLFIWFRGVQLFWPFYSEINFWKGFTPPDWWFTKLEYALEFGLISLFFYVLYRLAQNRKTNQGYLTKLKMWIGVELILFVMFSVLVFMWQGVFVVYGAAYIFSLSLALVVVLKMRETIEAV